MSDLYGAITADAVNRIINFLHARVLYLFNYVSPSIKLQTDEVSPAVLGDCNAALTSTQAWAAFLFASYLFGHLVFLLGSWQDEFYGCAQY